MAASGVNATAGPFAQSTAVLANTAAVLTNAGVGGVQSATWQLSYGSGAAAHVATVNVSASGTATPGTGCEIAGQALTTN
jgi:hypothetical protein